MPRSDTVECQSGFTYAERPVALTWNGQRLEIEQILESRRTPEGRYFRVTASQQAFELLYNEAEDDWLIRVI